METPYVITNEGCLFENEVEVAGVKFSGLTVDLSNGVTNREFVSNDADQAIRFFIMDLSPLNLTPAEVPTFVPNKYIASVDMLKSHDEYIITDMSASLKVEWEALQAELPNFEKFTLEMDRKDGYEGSFRVTAINSGDGKSKSHNYDFGAFTLLNNTVNKYGLIIARRVILLLPVSRIKRYMMLVRMLVWEQYIMLSLIVKVSR